MRSSPFAPPDLRRNWNQAYAELCTAQFQRDQFFRHRFVEPLCRRGTRCGEFRGSKPVALNTGGQFSFHRHDFAFAAFQHIEFCFEFGSQFRQRITRDIVFARGGLQRKQPVFQLFQFAWVCIQARQQALKF